MEPISVLLVDDQQLLREGMRILLDLEESLKVVGEANNGEEAITLYGQLQPDVVLMDVQMPTMNGLEATRRICLEDPQAKILILTTFNDDEYVFEAIRAGAVGYVLKAMSPGELASAVRSAYRGNPWLEASVARKLIDEFARTPPQALAYADASSLPEPLNERELEILRLMANGQRNRQIATQLHLAEGTVKNYVTSLLEKLNTPDRTQAILRARELGLV